MDALLNSLCQSTDKGLRVVLETVVEKLEKTVRIHPASYEMGHQKAWTEGIGKATYLIVPCFADSLSPDSGDLDNLFHVQTTPGVCVQVPDLLMATISLQAILV